MNIKQPISLLMDSLILLWLMVAVAHAKRATGNADDLHNLGHRNRRGWRCTWNFSPHLKGPRSRDRLQIYGQKWIIIHTPIDFCEQAKHILFFAAVFRIHRIHMFLGVPDPDPLVRCMDPDLSSSEKSKKNLASYCFMTSFGLFIFEKWCKCSFKK
jgi:hypothetical protein